MCCVDAPAKKSRHFEKIKMKTVSVDICCRLYTLLLTPCACACAWCKCVLYSIALVKSPTIFFC